MSDSTTYKKVGRGGAGNFWTQEDIVEVEKKEREDLEAQKTLTGPNGTDPAPSPEFVRSGRGGAGNYTTPLDSKLNAQISEEGIQQLRDTAAMVSSGRSTHRGLSGRGGAGNFRQVAEEEERKRVEEEESIKSRVNEQVLIDVNAMMKPPPRAHAAPQSYDSIV